LYQKTLNSFKSNPLEVASPDSNYQLTSCDVHHTVSTNKQTKKNIYHLTGESCAL